jgi:hypothetical protein
MSDENFIQEIEDNREWRELNKFCFADGKTIYSAVWINKVFDTKNEFKNAVDGVFYFVVRSNSRLLDIEHFFRILFIKLAEIECREISNEDVEYIGWTKPKGIRTYVIKYTIYHPPYWEENLMKLIYYMLTLSTIVDFPISGEEMASDSLSDALYEVYSGNRKVNPARFFHSGLAELFNVFIARKTDKTKHKSMMIEVPRLIGHDMEHLVLVLQSRDDLNSVLSRVEEFDSEKITNEALIQYDTIRRHF